MMMLTIYGVSIDSTRQVGKFVLVVIVSLPSYSMRSSDMNPPYIYINAHRHSESHLPDAAKYIQVLLGRRLYYYVLCFIIIHL